MASVEIVVITCNKDLPMLDGLLHSIKDHNITIAITKKGKGKNTVETNYDGDQRLIKKEIYYNELDFAYLRNEAKKDCDADWILSLDSDERLANPETLIPLCNALDKNNIHAGICNVVNTFQHSNKVEIVPMKAVRLFRSFLKWEYPIHEKINTALEGANEVNVSQTGITINHFGYAGNDVLIDKCKRNIELLEKALKKHKSKYLFDKLTQTYIDKIKLERGKLWLNQS